jgi:hypothetical protein
MASVTPIFANLLQNPSFETWNSVTSPTTWRVEDTNYARIYRESTVVFSGTYAAKLQRLQVGTGNNKGLLQRIILPLPSRGRYVARCRFYDNTDSVSGGMTITWRAADSSFISSWSTVYTVNQASWQTVERSAVTDTAPANAAIADFLIRTYGTSTTPAGGTYVADSASFDRFTGIEEQSGTELKNTLHVQVSPNPFNAKALISFSINPSNFKSLKIYDAAGNVVRTMTSPSYVNGAYKTSWDGRNEHAALCAPGIYFVTLETSNTATQTVKTLFLR